MFVHQLMANCWFGFGILFRCPSVTIPFIGKGLAMRKPPGSQTNNSPLNWVQQIQKMTKTSLDFAKGLLPEGGSLVISCGYLPKTVPESLGDSPVIFKHFRMGEGVVSPKHNSHKWKSTQPIKKARYLLTWQFPNINMLGVTDVLPYRPPFYPSIIHKAASTAPLWLENR